MTLGADDVKAADGTNLLRLVGDGRLVLFQQLLVLLPDSQNLRVVGFGIGIRLHEQLLRKAGFRQLRLGQEIGVAAQHDIRTTAGHVGGDGHRPEFTGLSHDLSLLLVVLGVQDIMRDALAPQHLAQQLALFDGNGAHQHGLSLFVAGLHLLYDGPVLARLVLIDHIAVVYTNHRLVGGNFHHVQRVNSGKFLFLGQGGTGHAGELVIQPEEILEGNGSERLALAGNVHALLGLNGLVQTLVVASAVHQPPGVFIHNDDFPVLDHIVDVLFHQAPGLHGLVDVVRQGGVLRVGQILHAEEPLGLGNAGGGQRHGAGLLIHEVVAVVVVVNLLVLGFGEDLLAQGGHKPVSHFVELGGILPLAGNDQGGTGLVD